MARYQSVPGIAGIVGPVVFTAAYLLQGLVRQGEYNATTEVVSDLEAGPGGWVQQLNFIVFGLLITTFAVGLHRGLHPSRAALAGPVLLGCNGVGLVIAGLFPMRQDMAGNTYDPTGIHTVNGAIFFLTIGIGIVILSRALAGDPSWRALAGYVLATGITLLIMFVALVTLARPAQGALHPWLGLAQRTALSVWMACIVVLATRLRRIVRRGGW